MMLGGVWRATAAVDREQLRESASSRVKDSKDRAKRPPRVRDSCKARGQRRTEGGGTARRQATCWKTVNDYDS